MKILSWDGYTFGSDLVAFTRDDSDPLSVQSESVARGHRYPEFGPWEAQGRRLRIDVARAHGSSLTTRGQVKALVGKLFYPRKGEKTMTAQHPSTGATVTLLARVVSPEPHQTFKGFVYTVDLFAPDPDWKGVATSLVAGPTLTNAGDALVHPLIRLTPSDAGPYIYRRRVTVSDQTGRGLANYPVVAAFPTNDIGMTGASDFYVVFKDQKVPFAVTGVGTATTKVVFRMHVPEAGSDYADVYYSAYVQNSETANALDLGQLDIAGTGFSNDAWVQAGAWNVSAAPAAACGVWTPIKLGNTVEGTSFGITAEGAGSVVVSTRPDASLPSDANGITMVVGSGLAASNAITGLVRALSYPTLSGAVNSTGAISFAGTGTPGPVYGTAITIQGPGGQAVVYYDADANAVKYAVAGVYNVPTDWVGVVKSGDPASGIGYTITFVGGFAGTAVAPMTLAANNLYGGLGASVSGGSVGSGGNVDNSARVSVMYRLAGEAAWRTAWSSTSAGSVSTAVSTPYAVQVAVILEPLTAASNADLTISGTVTLNLSASHRPTVALNPLASAGATGITAFLVNGTVTNSTTGQTLTMTDVLMDADTLVIDCDAGRVYTLGGTDWYGSAPLPSDPDEWMRLDPGANTVASSFWVPAAGGSGTTPSVVAVTYAWVPRHPLH